MARKRIPPFEMEVHGLAKGGTGRGVAPDGAEVRVRFAPPGGRVAVVPTGRSKGVWTARRTALIRPPAARAEPPCPVFALCGGCALQELGLEAQRWEKHRLGVAEARPGRDVRVHPPRGTPEAYGYRNKVELSFGARRYLSEADHAAGVPIEGRFLGFHAPGRFDRVVDTERCWLVDNALNAVLAVTRRVALAPEAPPPYDVRAHTGFWRHLLLRHGQRTGEVLAAVYTAGQDEEAAVERWATEVLALPGVVGVVWYVNDGVADVARGEVRRTWGRDFIEERLGERRFRLSPTSFFQTSTAGAELLYDTVAEALGEAGGTLLDLYCGTGTIGLYLADRFDHVIGVEQVPEAVQDARRNAVANGVARAEFHVGKVEDALHLLGAGARPRALVVDPPRAGLHPRATREVARADADVLVYVACSPRSLGRDQEELAAGGWRMTDLWTVDLFPQTGHVELVARFTRAPA